MAKPACSSSVPEPGGVEEAERDVDRGPEPFGRVPDVLARVDGQQEQAVRRALVVVVDADPIPRHRGDSRSEAWIGTISFQVCGGQEQGHFFGPVNEPNPTPPRPRLRYVIWLTVAIVTVAGVVLYFRYQTTLAPMLGGGK